MENIKNYIKKVIKKNNIVLFIKGTDKNPQCGFSKKAIEIIKTFKIKNIIYINVLENNNIRETIKKYSNWPTIPQLYIKQKFIGGLDIMIEMYNTGELKKKIS